MPTAHSAVSCSDSYSSNRPCGEQTPHRSNVPLDEGDAQIPNEDGQVDLTGNPSVARLRPLLSEDRSQEEFEMSLETLLDRLELSLSQ